MRCVGFEMSHQTAVNVSPIHSAHSAHVLIDVVFACIFASLDGTTLELFKKEYEYLFVDFYASWCSHCKILAPTWETLAEIMADAGSSAIKLASGQEHLDDYSEEDLEHAKKVHMPVVIAKIDCVAHPAVCNQQENIQAYPTLRLFVDGKTWEGGSDYKGHRTVMDMVDWLAFMENQHKTLMEKDDPEGEMARKLHAAHDGKTIMMMASSTCL
jgi:thiol-disulfide isomerase/thioredoxin